MCDTTRLCKFSTIMKARIIITPTVATVYLE